MILKNDPFTIEQEPMRNPFVGIPSFLMAPLCFDLDQLEADIAVIGMPYDLGTSVNTGARFGPGACGKPPATTVTPMKDGTTPSGKRPFWASRGKLSTAATWMSCIPSRPAAFKTARRPFGKSFPKKQSPLSLAAITLLPRRSCALLTALTICV